MPPTIRIPPWSAPTWSQESLPDLNIKDAGIMIDGRSRLLDQNYRNSREILKCAYNFIFDHLNDEMFRRKEMPIQDPKEANFTGPAPAVLKANSFISR